MKRVVGGNAGDHAVEVFGIILHLGIALEASGRLPVKVRILRFFTIISRNAGLGDGRHQVCAQMGVICV